MKQDRLAARADAEVWQHRPVSTQDSRRKLVDSHAGLMRCYHGQTIYDEGTPVEYWHRVVSGTARRFVVRPDGRRQIIDLLLAGDVFGFGARGSHSFTAEAIRDGTVVARYPRSRLESVARSDTRVTQEIQQMALAETRRLQELILILAEPPRRRRSEPFCCIWPNVLPATRRIA